MFQQIPTKHIPTNKWIGSTTYQIKWKKNESKSKSSFNSRTSSLCFVPASNCLLTLSSSLNSASIFLCSKMLLACTCSYGHCNLFFFLAAAVSSLSETSSSVSSSALKVSSDSEMSELSELSELGASVFSFFSSYANVSPGHFLRTGWWVFQM